MKGLKCTTNNCEFNEGCHCTAGIINVDKSGICRTKLKRENGIVEQEFINMEVASEFDYSDNPDLDIMCESTACVHNRGHRCVAQMVKIADTMLTTKCKTREV